MRTSVTESGPAPGTAAGTARDRGQGLAGPSARPPSAMPRPPERMICAHGPIYAYCSGRHSYSAFGAFLRARSLRGLHTVCVLPRRRLRSAGGSRSPACSGAGGGRCCESPFCRTGSWAGHIGARLLIASRPLQLLAAVQLLAACPPGRPVNWGSGRGLHGLGYSLIIAAMTLVAIRARIWVGNHTPRRCGLPPRPTGVLVGVWVEPAAGGLFG